MTYNPQIHRRRSIRLKDYDYSQSGAYFLTFCIFNRECLLGKIRDGKILLNRQGQMVQNWWYRLPEKFFHIELDEFIVMPNHFHGIIWIVDSVGADRSVCPENGKLVVEGGRMGPPQPGPPQRRSNQPDRPYQTDPSETGRSKQVTPIPRIVQWFKTMTTNEYLRGVKQFGWRSLGGKLWQRDYYEHIIRNEKELDRIRHYIVMNPLKWENGNENPVRN